MSANTDVIQGIYDAFAAGDVAGVLGRMDPGIFWMEAENFPYADNNPYVGPEAVAGGVFMRCATEWDGFAVKVEEIVDAGDTVIAFGRYLGTYKATGRAQDTQMAHVWRFDGSDKPKRFQQYADTLGVARVIGTAV